jgi:hypothetical protein
MLTPRRLQSLNPLSCFPQQFQKHPLIARHCIRHNIFRFHTGLPPITSAGASSSSLELEMPTRPASGGTTPSRCRFSGCTFSHLPWPCTLRRYPSRRQPKLSNAVVEANIHHLSLFLRCSISPSESGACFYLHEHYHCRPQPTPLSTSPEPGRTVDPCSRHLYLTMACPSCPV